MKHIHRTVHYTKKLLKHRQNQKLILLFILILTLPILVYNLGQQTQLKPRAATLPACASPNTCQDGLACSISGGHVVFGAGQSNCTGNTSVCCSATTGAGGSTAATCEANGDVCVPVNQLGPNNGQTGPSNGLCSNGQSPLTQYTCTAGYACCRPGVSFPGGQGGNQCGGCSGACTQPGRYCEQPTTQNNQFAVSLCDSTSGTWKFQYNQAGSNTCKWTAPAAGTAPLFGGDTCAQNGGTCVAAGKVCTSVAPGTYVPSDNAAVHCPSGSGQTCCMPGSAKVAPKPVAPRPPTCTCDNNGYGAPFNHFTCKDYQGKVVTDRSCSTTEICDNNVGYPFPCKSPKPVVCTCQHPGQTDKALWWFGQPVIGKSNDYRCTDDGSQHYCAITETCGSQNFTKIPGNAKSNYPQNPCIGIDKQLPASANVPKATLNSVTAAAAIGGLVNPYPSIQLTYDFINQQSTLQSRATSNQTLAKANVLAAQIFTATDTLRYDPTTNTYINKNFNMDKIPAGTYLVFAKVDGFLAARVKGLSGETVFTIAKNKRFDPDIVTLIAGDIAPSPHGDNFIDIYDYNVIIGCYGKQPINECKLADLNNDGKIDDGDAEIIFDRFWKFGDSYTEPNFSCVSDPTCTTGGGSLQMCALKCTKNIDF